MQPRPLGRYAAPRYPAKLEVHAAPALLERARPASWLRDEALAAVAAAAVLAQSGCAERVPPAVAPVAVHGDGVASVGCVVVSPPSYLSEEDAQRIIREEAARRGLLLAAPSSPVLGEHILAPARPASPYRKWWNALYEPREAYVPDLADSAKKIAVEFVGDRDALRFANPGLRSPLKATRSAYAIDMRSSAQNLSVQVSRKGAPGFYFGAVYDPAVKTGCGRPGSLPPEKRQECEASARAASEQLLREQVADFLDWLKAQGAL